MNPIVFLHAAFARLVQFCVVLAVMLGMSPTVRGAWPLLGIGYNFSQQLGAYPEDYAFEPVALGDDVSVVGAGLFNTGFLKNDGTLWFLGSWNTGDDAVSEPLQMASGVSAFALGTSHLLWIDEAGVLWARGHNHNGQLGDGTTQDRDSAVRVAEGVVRVAAGSSHSLFLKNDGSLWGMGRNLYGALGDGTELNRATPVLIASGVIEIAAGEQHSLFIKADGGLWAMGQNFGGQLGDGTRGTRFLPVLVASGARLVSGGNGHSLFVKTDGSLWAMGDNADGQLGDGTQERRTLPVRVAETVVAIDAGVGHSVFLRADGSLWIMGVTPWERAADVAAIRVAPTRVEGWVRGVATGGYHTLFLQSPVPTITPSALTVLAGASVTLELTPSAGAAWTYQWYRGVAGYESQPVAGATSASFITPPLFGEASYWARVYDATGPVDTTAVTVVGCSVPSVTTQPPGLTLRAGQNADLAVAATGGALAYQWYEGASGDTTRPIPGATAARLLTPALWGSSSFWVRVSNVAGVVDSTVAAVTVAPSDGMDLLATGYNSNGQLFDGTVQARALPAVSLRGVAKVAGGLGHTLLLKTDGTLWAVGTNDYGQLGDGTVVNRSVPVLVSADVVDAVAGPENSYFIKRDASLWLVGRGMAPNGATTVNTTPVRIASHVAMVATARVHALFVKIDGSLWALGENGNAELGDGTNTDRPEPVLVAPAAKRIAAGWNHSFYVAADGTLFAAGSNSQGVLGVENISGRWFVPVTGDVAEVWTSTSSSSHARFLKTDGSLWSMGQNDYGQLGDGTKISRTSPVQIATGVVEAAVGGSHGVFLKTDGTVWTHGNNLSGQLGDGSDTTRPTPVQIGIEAVRIAAGGDTSFFVQRPRPVVTTQPENSVTSPGGTATFTVAATSHKPINYQWYRGVAGDESAPVVGANAPTLVTSSLATSGNYWVKLTNTTGSTASRTVEAVMPPVITAQPTGSALPAGHGAVFSVSASGGAMTYQWYQGLPGDTSRPLAGARGARFVTGELVEAQTFWVRAINAAGTADGAAVSVAPSADVNLDLQVVGNRNYIGTTAQTTTPLRISLDVARAAGGGDTRSHHLFIKTDGTLWAMGSNTYGQLGDGTTTNRTEPVLIASEVRQVSTGFVHSLFVKRDGTLWSMGDNSNGQLGDGTTTARLAPVQIASEVRQASAGYAHSLFVKTDGTLWAVGRNTAGELGDGTTTSRSAPIQVATGVAQVRAGGYAGTGLSVFVTRDAQLWGMGANDARQLADGTTVNRATPVRIATDVVFADCGAQHILFLKADGALWSAGANNRGQLGVSSSITPTAPVHIADGVVRLAAGAKHSLFLTGAEELWSMGENNRGQLGNGNTIQSGIPALVRTRVRDVAAGGDSTLFLQAPPPTITLQPASLAIVSGQSTTLVVEATDAGAITYQWYAGAGGNTTQPIAGATSAAFTTPALTTSSQYWVRVSNLENHRDSQTAQVTVCTVPVFIGITLTTTVNHGVTQAIVTNASGELVAFQWFIGEPGDTSAPIAGATLNRFNTPPATATLRYWVRATNIAGVTNSPALVVSVRPIITGQPVPASAILGQPASLTVVAGGSAPFTYQWYRGASGDTSEPLGGQTAATLTLTPINQEIRYWARVANVVGTIDSQAATLVGVVAPTITTQPTVLPSRAGASQGMDIARVAATGGGLSHQWYRGESGDISEPVTGATGALFFTRESGRFWVRISNLSGTVDADAITITVAPLVPLALRAMGANNQGQLGQGTTANQLVPVRPALDVVQVAAGTNHSLFVKADGTLWGMGYNAYGQLGSSAYAYSVPTQITTDVVSVATGDEHTLYLKRDGSLWSIGSNAYGQRGNGVGGGVSSSAPTLVATGVARIAAGRFHSLFIKLDGGLWGMGLNANGQLGLPGVYSTPSPMRIASDVLHMAAGNSHSLFVTADGVALGMGLNTSGQLGDGTGTSRQLPVIVLTDVTSVAAGSYHSLFIKTDDTLWTVGYNSFGALGDGTAVAKNRPVQVATNVATAAGDRFSSQSGVAFSFFVKRDGTLWAMGSNYNGQLGDGTTTGRLVPVQVASGVGMAAAGGNHALFTQTPPPTITGQSTEVGIVAGQSATLLVEAQSDSAITYQWYAGATGVVTQPITGATAATFATPALTVGTTYWVRASNAFGPTDSATITVTICTVPTIATEPIAPGLLAGQRASLFVQAAGGALGYQWYQGAPGDVSTPVAGATGAGFATPPLGQSTAFWVRVTNAAGATDSAAALVTVFAKANLMATGDNSHGQLGLGFGGGVTSAITVSSDVAKISAGGSHTLILKTDGTLWTAGLNGSGQLGDGTTTDRAAPVQIATGVVEIAAGGSHSLFAKSDGTLWGMGGNTSGQLGDGTTTNRNAPVQIGTDVTDFAAGSSHTLFRKSDGTLFACGSNSSGQLGDGATTNRATPYLVASSVARVTAGSSHTLILKTDGTLSAAGLNSSGQLGDGTTTTRSTFVGISTNVVRISAGGSFTWFVKSDGSLWTVGNGASGQLADGGAANRSTPAQVATGVAQIEAGSSHGLFLKTDGSLWTVGDNDLGQLGDGSLVARSTPVNIAAGVVQISAGSRHSLFVTEGGTLFAVGDNTHGQLGDGERTNRVGPALALANIIALSAGDAHTMFITTDQTLWGVGRNDSGQLGDGSTLGRVAPVAIATGVARVVAAGAATFFIKTDGTLWAMGSNQYGQLGLGLVASVSAPALVAVDVRDVAGSGEHALFVKTDGTLWAMGANYAGQLGFGPPGDGFSSQPVLIASQVARATVGQSAVIPGYGFSAFLKTDGTLWTMGNNTYGQLGNGSVGSPSTAQPIPSQIATGVAQISAGRRQLLFVKRDGTLWGSGWNLSGEIGTGVATIYRSPVQVATQVAQVATGPHTLILKRNGSLWATGPNIHGQLGDGTTTSRTVPVQIATGVLDLAVGGTFSLFLQIPPPVILVDPASLVRRLGTQAEFVVTVAADSGSLAYQWRRAGVVLGGAASQSARLVIDGVLTADAGDYDVVVTGASGQAISAPATLTVHIEEYTTYAAWAAGNAAVGGALSDPDGAGAPNLMRFAFKLPARGPVSAPVLAQTTSEADGTRLAVAFTRKTYAPGLRYVVEGSSDLVTWTSVSIILPGLPETVVARDILPLGAMPRRFLRVRAEMTP